MRLGIFLIQFGFFMSMILLPATGYKYEFIVANDDLFNDCHDQPPTVFGINVLFNLSEFTIVRDGELFTIGGNITSMWEVTALERLEFKMQAFSWDRGSWQPTLYSITSKDFCKEFYLENFYWYTYAAQYIINRNDIKDRCFLPGTKLCFEEFQLYLVVNIPNGNLHGTYKMRFTLEAYDLEGKQNPISFCCDVRGEYSKLKS
ncbi:hypothetical protein KR009_000955 [Drosophila setifemur]|nr:hypothetical protein KR009_000955 [Drosophila setifemur]